MDPFIAGWIVGKGIDAGVEILLGDKTKEEMLLRVVDLEIGMDVLTMRLQNIANQLGVEYKGLLKLEQKHEIIQRLNVLLTNTREYPKTEITNSIRNHWIKIIQYFQS